ncbi:MAG: sugar-binding transcriptional regulator [Anaerolineales bacterium]
MVLPQLSRERSSLLADVAEWYYIDGLKQSEIASKIGVDRSMVSRMLAEARLQNIVEIRIHRPISTNRELEKGLIQSFGLNKACVLEVLDDDYDQLLKQLGEAGAMLLKDYLHPGITLGLSWGTGVSAVVDAFEQPNLVSMQIVQLVGALGAQNSVYDGHGLVQRLAQEIGCQGYFLNAPFIVDSPDIVQALLSNQNVAEAMSLAKNCDVALVGVGSTEPEYSSFYQAGYVPLEELICLRESGMVGDICGRHFNLEGESPELDFHKRIVTISEEDLRNIPIRIAVAGGIGKAEAILGALRAGYINILVTDDQVAKKLLEDE